MFLKPNEINDSKKVAHEVTYSGKLGATNLKFNLLNLNKYPLQVQLILVAILCQA